MGQNLESCSVDSDNQNDVIESGNSEFSKTGHMSLEISESTDQVFQQQADFQDAPGKSLESNQEHDSMQINNPSLTSHTNHILQIKEDEQNRVLAQEKVIYISPKKKHAFVKPDPVQIAAEARAKSKK